MFFTLTLHIGYSGDDESEWNTSERVVYGAVVGDVGSEHLDTGQ
jgi:hypothetical protein